VNVIAQCLLVPMDTKSAPHTLTVITTGCKPNGISLCYPGSQLGQTIIRRQ